MKCPIQVNLICQCCVRMWAVITLAKDIDFHWALWYGKCPRSLVELLHDRYSVLHESISESITFNVKITMIRQCKCREVQNRCREVITLIDCGTLEMNFVFLLA